MVHTRHMQNSPESPKDKRTEFQTSPGHTRHMVNSLESPKGKKVETSPGHTRQVMNSQESPKGKKVEISPTLFDEDSEKDFRSPIKTEKRSPLSNGVTNHIGDLSVDNVELADDSMLTSPNNRSPILSERQKLSPFEDRRRSGRERRFTYDTYNQSAIADVYLGMGDIEGSKSVSPRHRRSSGAKRNKMIVMEEGISRKRGRRSKRSFVEVNEGDENLMNNDSSNMVSADEGTSEDMYSRIKRQRRDKRRVTYDEFINSVRSRRHSKKGAMESRSFPRRSLRQKSSPVYLQLSPRRRRTRIAKEPLDDSANKVDNEEGEHDTNNKTDENDAKDEGEEEEEEEDEEDEEEEEEEEESSESSEEAPRKYSLRERRGPPIPIYQPDFGERRLRRSRISSLMGSRRHHEPRVCRPRSRQGRSLMRRSTHNRGGSTTSSSSSDSESGTSADEARFERRKAKSMARARKRCLPMNFTEEDMKSHNVLRDRSMAGASLADVEPMSVDKSVSFESVGGLDHVVRSLKEMVLFPLLYPEVFENFNVTPPRGVLFHGPPGTGKTLIARALANVCSEDTGRKVAFFMRKGADCLSKWVGESERQLRLLFNEAYTMRPAIIFFDEIDGLAPVRSTRQDQIHSSIVSTLLALMDGLDNRGEIIVIGATNRLDAIDPALRRPGRFDREFFFPLPREAARQQIIQIHTEKWPNPLSPNMLGRLAKVTGGYCGADLKALCTEAVLSGLRRRYPQIYVNKAKLQLNLKEIEVAEADFQVAMETIVPAGQRVESLPSRPLSEAVMPLLKEALSDLLERIRKEFPSAAKVLRRQDAGEDDVSNSLITDDAVDEHGKVQSWTRMVLGGHGPQLLCRPRLLLQPTQDVSWQEDESLSSNTNIIDRHLLPAVFHRLEGIHVLTIDTPTLFNVSARTPEESLSQLWREALRLAPSIVYIPQVNELLASLPDTVVYCLLSLIQSGDPGVDVFVLATESNSTPLRHAKLAAFFNGCYHRCAANPGLAARRLFFQDVFITWPSIPPPTRKLTAQRMLEVLPVVPDSEQNVPRKLSSKESERLFEQEEMAMCQLRLLLREVLSKINRDRRFTIFGRPVDKEDVPDYYEIIKNPMDLSKITHKLDTHKYETAKAFLDDIDQICSNALEYNPTTTPQDREIRHRACCMRDFAISEIQMLIADEFLERCEYIASARKRRGVDGSSTVPNFILTKPPDKSSASNVHPSLTTEDEKPTQATSSHLEGGQQSAIPSAATGHRLSRRLKNLAPPAALDISRRRSRGRPRENSPVDVDPVVTGLIDAEDVNDSNRRSSSNYENVCNSISPIFRNGDDEKKTPSEKKQEKKAIPRLTRGLTANNPLAERAVAILEEPTPELVVQTVELSSLLEFCIVRTDGWSISRLEHLYSRLAASLISFERVWDRTRLSSEYRDIFESFNL